MTIDELGRNPIAGASPSGDDVRYDPLFDALQAEVDIKPSAGSGGTNWKKVVELSSTILETKSKDILVASYLSVGLLHTKEMPDGLLDGVTIIRLLVEQFWDTLFPPVKRMRGRTQAIGWWLEKTMDYLSNIEVQPLPAETQLNLVSAVDGLFELMSEKCPDAPSLRQILTYVKALPVEGGADEAEESTDSSTIENEAQTAPAPARTAQKTAQSGQRDETLSTTAINNSDDATRLLSGIIEKNYLLVDFMIAIPSPQPSWYSLNLLSAWFDINKLPPATNRKTLIPPPDRQISNTLVAMKLALNWTVIIKSSCFNIRRYPFWLDMNRYTAEALGALGEQYKDARLAVEKETLFFTQRFSGIGGYSFSDGTPFADQQTEKWISGLSGEDAGPARPIEIAGDDVATKVAEGFEQFRQMFANGKQREGLTAIHDLLRASGSARERYMWRLSLVRLLSISGMEKLAIPHLNELMKDYDQYHLEEWDPVMALNVLRTVWNVLRTQEDPESKKRADDIMSRISMLSPSEAFNLVK